MKKLKFNSERLRQVLAGRRLPVMEVSRAVGITPRTLGKLILGTTYVKRPSLSILHKLSEAFNVPIEEWLIEEE